MKKVPPHTEGIFGIAWYRKDQWDLLRIVSDKPETLEDSYEEWLTNANKLKNNLEQLGITAKEIGIDINDVVVWCKSTNNTINSKSITEYVILKLKELYK
jgi:hypothetical protein